jgi:hypothetical protein
MYMIRVNLPNRPEGDPTIIPGLGEFPNGGAYVVRDDVLSAYLAGGNTPLEELNWPDGIESVELTPEFMQTVFEAAKKTKADEAKKTSKKAPVQEGGN